jgi:hypothetical protein
MTIVQVRHDMLTISSCAAPACIGLNLSSNLLELRQASLIQCLSRDTMLFYSASVSEPAYSVGLEWRNVQGDREADSGCEHAGHGHQAAARDIGDDLGPSLSVRAR